MDQVVLICSECIEERKAKTQENVDEKISKLLNQRNMLKQITLEEKHNLLKQITLNQRNMLKQTTLKDKIEKIWFKIKLTSGELNEHVWIHIIDINLKDRTFCGNIDNDIYFVSDKYAYGDQVIAGFGKIEEIFTE